MVTTVKKIDCKRWTKSFAESDNDLFVFFFTSWFVFIVYCL